MTKTLLMTAAVLVGMTASANAATFTEIDTNKDGYLSISELRAVFSDSFATAMMGGDRNLDQRLSKNEARREMKSVQKGEVTRARNTVIALVRKDLSNKGFTEEQKKAAVAKVKELSAGEIIAAAKAAHKNAEAAYYDSVAAAYGYYTGGTTVTKAKTNKELEKYATAAMKAQKNAVKAAKKVTQIKGLTAAAQTNVERDANDADAGYIYHGIDYYGTAFTEAAAKVVSDAAATDPDGLDSHAQNNTVEAGYSALSSGYEAGAAADTAEQDLAAQGKPIS